MDLTAAQRRAVTHADSDVCVVAGPGSGKTRVLVERFCWLVQQGLAEPSRILTITFTERAAYEIKRRLAARFQHDPARRAEIERAPVSTVHGFCTKLLKENAIAAGLDPEFRVLDERLATLMLREAIDESLDALLTTDPERLRDLYESWAAPNPVTALADAYETLRLSGTDWPPPPSPSLQPVLEDLRHALAARPPADTPTRRRVVDSLKEWLERASQCADPAALDHEIADLRHYRGPLRDPIENARTMLASVQNARRLQTLDFLLRDIHSRYAVAKSGVSAVDFDDLEAFSIDMLSGDARLRKSIQSRFDFILMDELQDTNPLQWRLVELIRREGRFFAVGDINQAIYGFRHATPAAFQMFRQRAQRDGAVVYLRDNFRSRSEIVRAACETCGTQEGVEPPDLQAGRSFASSDPSPVERIAIAVEDNSQIASLEARAVCARILELVRNFMVEKPEGSRPAQFRDIAILFRTSKRYPEFEKSLEAARIPYILTSGRAFFERQEVLDLLNWLRVLANPLDEIALAGVLRSPLVGTSDETLLRIRRPGQSLIETVRTSGEQPLTDFVRLLERSRAQMDDVSPDRLLNDVVDESNYEATLDTAARANVRKLLSLVRDWSTGGPAPLATLIEYLDRLSEAGEEPNAPANDSPDAVQIMTVHGAKGLEFPIVFLAGLDLRPQTDSAGLCFSPEAGLGAKWRRAGDEVYDAAANAYKEASRQREREEGNRLLYVGLTRAEQKLILSHGLAKSGWPALVESVAVTQTITAPATLPISAVGAAAAIAEQFIDPPPPGEQSDHATTATGIALFAQCPRRYLLERYIGWRSPARSDDEESFPPLHDGELVATETGQMVHALLAGEQDGPPTTEAKRLADVFHASPLGQRAQQASRAEREFSFVAKMEGMVVNGQMDLWFQDAGELVLVDYKTDHVTPAEVSNVARSYAPQLAVYASVLERITGRRPDRAVLHFLRPDVLAEMDVSTGAIEKTKETIRHLRQAQQNMAFPLEEASHCKRCPHWRGACPSKFGQEQLGLFD